MTDRIDDALRFHQQGLNLRARRQQLLSSNIANADTPHYKARDIDFRQALAHAVAGKTGPLALVQTSRRHLEPRGGGPFEAAMRYRTEHQGSVDGNTVNADVERAAFAENAVHYEATLTFMNGILRTMQTAIQGQ